MVKHIKLHNYIITSAAIIICLLIGGAIYALRSPEFIGFDKTPLSIDIINSFSLPAWVLYSLPDGLWMLAFLLFIFMIWEFQIHAKSMGWVLLVLILGFGQEIFQSIGIVPGTYDPIDILAIGIAGLLSFFLIININRYEVYV